MIGWLALAGCARPETTDASWLEGFAFGWDLFNHRLSRLHAQVDDRTGEVAFVGGTSTTGVDPTLASSCDPYTCQEFPFVDTSTITLRYGHVSTADARFAVGRTTLLVGATGADSDITVHLADPGETLVAVLQEISLTTDVALLGEEPSCYDPSNGWHPRRLQVSLGVPVLAGSEVKVPVHATFEAGNSLEPERACIDAIKDFAQVGLTVGATLISTDVEPVRQQVTGGMTFAWGGTGVPAEQVPTDDNPLDHALTPQSIVGWTGFDWTFHGSDPDLRGAYLRTLELRLDLADRTAAGQATNYSPGSQLSGFEYTFSGDLVGVPVEGQLEHGYVTVDEVPAALETDGTAVLTTVAVP